MGFLAYSCLYSIRVECTRLDMCCVLSTEKIASIYPNTPTYKDTVLSPIYICTYIKNNLLRVESIASYPQVDDSNGVEWRLWDFAFRHDVILVLCVICMYSLWLLRFKAFWYVISIANQNKINPIILNLSVKDVSLIFVVHRLYDVLL